ncbi:MULTISPECIES: hypothetical protein [unclassified Nitrobacter]|nr:MULTISPECIES: hypothetical protein [unclassified Nitrobacter]
MALFAGTLLLALRWVLMGLIALIVAALSLGCMIRNHAAGMKRGS